MSYLIQNLSYFQPTLRLNVRIKSAIIARNVYVIYNLLNNSAKILNTLAVTSYHAKLPKDAFMLINPVFSALMRVLFPKIKYLRYTPIGINFPQAARYKTLWELNMMLFEEAKFTPILLDYNRFSLNPYFIGSPISITPVAKKPYSETLFKVTRMVLGLWFSWPRSYRLTTHYTNIYSQWYLLRFLNKYYFKLYHI